MSKWFIASAISICLSPAPMRAAAQDDDARVALFERARRRCDDRRTFQRVGVIIHDGRTVRSRASDSGCRVAPRHPRHALRHRVADENVTSLLLLQCVERGTLSSTNACRGTTAIPEPDATVRHVLTHTSQGSPVPCIDMTATACGAAAGTRVMANVPARSPVLSMHDPIRVAIWNGLGVARPAVRRADTGALRRQCGGWPRPIKPRVVGRANGFAA